VVRIAPSYKSSRDKLGLTPLAMAKLRWEIIDDPLPETVGEKVLNLQFIRQRIKTVE
jgi:hypothetical protein